MAEETPLDRMLSLAATRTVIFKEACEHFRLAQVAWRAGDIATHERHHLAHADCMKRWDDAGTGAASRG